MKHSRFVHTMGAKHSRFVHTMGATYNTPVKEFEDYMIASQSFSQDDGIISVMEE